MSAASIIVVEDHDALRELTLDFLGSRGHFVRGAPDGATLDELMVQAQAQVLVLDINLPGESGLDICRRLRASYPDLGIVMLTALGGDEQRVQGYETGADIYLAKPTSQGELAAAVESLARRIHGRAEDHLGLFLDTATGRIRGPSGEEQLTEAEVMILRGLTLAANRQLEYWQLLEMLGTVEQADARAALEVRITRLRRKLKDAGASHAAIKSVRRLGYRLTDPWRVK